jgi:hypothetical protein
MGMEIEEIAESAALIDATAEAAARTYYEHAVKFGMAKWPRYGLRKSRNWPRFGQIARMCILHKIPVEAFVTAAFTRAMERHSLVTVGDICMFNPDNLTSGAFDRGTSCPQDLWNMLSCKMIDMRFALEGVRDTLELLDNSMYGFPAWFRVFAPEKPVQDLIVHWGDLAWDELSENKPLDEYIRAKRPETYELLKSVVKSI